LKFTEIINDRKIVTMPKEPQRSNLGSLNIIDYRKFSTVCSSSSRDNEVKWWQWKNCYIMFTKPKGCSWEGHWFFFSKKNNNNNNIAFEHHRQKLKRSKCHVWLLHDLTIKASEKFMPTHFLYFPNYGTDSQIVHFLKFTSSISQTKCTGRVYIFISQVNLTFNKNTRCCIFHLKEGECII
jgi:hypothetical protein